MSKVDMPDGLWPLWAYGPHRPRAVFFFFFFLISKQNLKIGLFLFYFLVLLFILFYFILLQNDCSKKIKLNRKNKTKFKRRRRRNGKNKRKINKKIKYISKFQFDQENRVDEEPLCGCATTKSSSSASYPDVSCARAKEGGKETTGDTALRLPSVPFPWSLAAHHHLAKNDAPEEEAASSSS